MRLHHSFGMNPRATRMFLIEKGIFDEVDKVDVNLLAGENRQGPFLSKNPAGQTPCLELDDGSYLAESAAIYEYLEEKFPGNTLFGNTPEERAEARMWLRRAEINICIPAVHAFYYSEGLDLFKTRVHCIPEAADGLKEKTQKAIQWLDGLLEGRQYLCGDRFTIGDIVLFCYVDQLQNGGQPIDDSNVHFKAWFDRVAARPSADASVWHEQPMGMRG